MEFNKFEQEQLQKGAGILRALAHPLRIQLTNYIFENQPVKVFDIHKNLQLDQSTTSQHLKILRDNNIVNTRRDGKNIFYSVERERISYFIKQIQIFDKMTLASRKRR